jgi:hypothetical protein
MSIFDKESFTLKELCTLLLNTKKIYQYDEIYNICLCYINFSSDNKNYRTYLSKTRSDKGIIYIDNLNNKKLIFRELLQMFDMEFTKLVITIKTECKNYDIYISWSDFEEKTKNISKLELKEFIDSNLSNKN